MKKPRTHYTDAELGYPTAAHGRIPLFANRDEEATFWDTHDVTDFDGEELRQIEVEIGGDKERLRHESEAEAHPR